MSRSAMEARRKNISRKKRTSGATINWNAPKATYIEIHVGSPNGPLFTYEGNRGSSQTGPWVADGTTFYLQDVTGGKPLTANNTLALLVVHLQRL